MNYGYFFALDHESSDLGLGITVFNYKPVKVGDNDYENNPGSPRYPIFCSFRKDGAYFYIHYDIDDVHSLGPILKLETSTDDMTRDRLTKVITESYSTEYQAEKIDKYISHEVDSKVGGLYYSNLEQFTDGKNIPIIRKIILDFMFDMEHTEVFRNSPHYNTIYSNLHRNPLYHAIVAKAEYYYQRKYANENIQEDKDEKCVLKKLFSSHSSCDFKNSAQEKTDIIVKNNIFLLRELAEAEQRWVDIISKSDTLFDDNKWFKQDIKNKYKSSNLEMDDVFRHDITKKTGEKKLDCIEPANNPHSNSDNNVKKNLACIERTNNLLDQIIKFKTHIYSQKEQSSTKEEQIQTLKAQILPSTERLLKILIETKEQATRWYLSERDLRGIGMVRNGSRGRNWSQFAFILIPTVLIFSFSIIKLFGSVEHPTRTMSRLCLIMAVAFIIISLFQPLGRRKRYYFRRKIINSSLAQTLSKKSVTRVKKCPKIELDTRLWFVKLAAALAAAWLPLVCESNTYDFLEYAGTASWGWTAVIVFFCVLLFVFTWSFVYRTMKNNSPSNPRKNTLTRSITIIGITFVYSYFIGLAELMIFGYNLRQDCSGDFLTHNPFLFDYAPRILALTFLCMFVGLLLNNIGKGKAFLE